jgi:hypothetical protein
MLHLSLAGLSEDGRRLLLVDSHGTEYTLDVDARLTAALRGEHARLGQLEIKMESTLRPRDIQARIRAGETPEAVAQAANTSVERIMPFAGPVIAERAHVAQRAQRSSVRRRSGVDTGVRTLGDAVENQLRALNTDPETVEWDSCRREDGRWSLTAIFATSKRKGTARFAFDMPGNYCITENDDARWLVGDLVEKAPAPPAEEPRDELRKARERRRPHRGEELPLGDDVLELVNEEPPAPAPAPEPVARAEAEAEAGAEERTVDLGETAAAVRKAGARDDVALEPTPEPLAEAAPEPSRDEPAEPVEAVEEKPRPRPKKKGRASVPSWDEIMFGGGKSE